MPRVFVTHRVHDTQRWLELAGAMPRDVVGADAIALFTCLDDPAKVGLILEFPDGADVRLLLAAIADHPGVAELIDRVGAIRETVEVYIEHAPR